MADVSTPIRRFADLIDDVFRLRTLIESAREDAAFSERRRLIYLVDPAILDLYTDPDDWAPQVAALPSLHTVPHGPSEDLFDTTLEPKAILNAAALITGEYIFSKTLAGSDGYLYVSPEHMGDLIGHVARIERKYNVAADRLERAAVREERLYSDIHHRLSGQRAAFAANSFGEAEWLKRTRDILVGELGDIASHTEILAAHRLLQLAELDVLAPAESLSEYTSDIIAPPAREIDWWEKAISSAKRFSPRRASQEAIEADAVTLQQIYMLNSEASDEGQRFVLITHDLGLHAAFARRCRDEPGTFFAIRHPAQYMPVLNMSSMGGDIVPKGVFDRIEEAVAGVVDLFRSTDLRRATPSARWVGSEVRSYLLSTRGSQTIARVQGEIETAVGQISTDWRSLLTFACSAKADVIRGAIERESDYWRDFTNSALFRKEISRTASALRDQFASLAETSALVRQEIWALEAKAQKRPDDYIQRALVSAFSDYDTPRFQGSTIHEILRQLDGARGADALRAISNIPERRFVVGSLCLEIGAWSGALNFFDRADTKPRLTPPPDTIEREIRFMKCVSMRLAATPRDWDELYRGAHQELDRLIETSKDSSFDMARNLSELLALTLCWIAWSDADTKSTDARIGLTLDLVDRCLAAAPSFELDAPPPPILALGRQITLNTLNAAYWCWIVRGAVPEKLQQQCEVAFKRLDRWAQLLIQSPHFSLYPKLAMLALSDEGDRASIKEELRAESRGLLEADREAGFAFDLPYVDKVELQKVLRRLQ
jgi:hypothetical protein